MDLDTLGRARYVSLTTYRKNGTGVATPVWAAVEDGELLVWTREDSWKVRRLRRDPRVLVAPCDVRGQVAEDAPRATGTARLLTGDGLTRARKALARKYTWQFWLTDKPASLVRRGKRPQVGIAVTLGGQAPPAG
ncbi:PPOX class F420-dependent oxidoreductase [Streptomyces sp. NPDC049954]|uniref:PPOX class F420-dependent oxidoreductase n=1 Tax=Streptomyces sp. NPDC049954 TaxID=3155779 RepID=UPI00341A2FDE